MKLHQVRQFAMDEISKVKNNGKPVLKLIWSDIDYLVDKLEVKINKEKLVFNSIYGVPRGGLVVAVMLSHRLNLPIVEAKGINKNTLIVDDICDKGLTLKGIYESYNIIKHFELSTAVLHLRKLSEYSPTFYGQ